MKILRPQKKISNFKMQSKSNFSKFKLKFFSRCECLRKLFFEPWMSTIRLSFETLEEDNENEKSAPNNDLLD